MRHQVNGLVRHGHQVNVRHIRADLVVHDLAGVVAPHQPVDRRPVRLATLKSGQELDDRFLSLVACHKVHVVEVDGFVRLDRGMRTAQITTTFGSTSLAMRLIICADGSMQDLVVRPTTCGFCFFSTSRTSCQT
jgi:hypothetical protein